MAAPKSKNSVSPLTILTLTAMFVFLGGLGSYGMLDPTDSFFVESAREMMETKTYLYPLINYEPWLDKPALAFLFIIGAFKTLGVNAMAARLPSAVSGITLVLLTFFLIKQIVPTRIAFVAAALLMASPLLVGVGHLALTDEPFTLFVTGSIMSGFVYKVRALKRYLVLTAVLMGLALLCKGPLAICLFALAFASFEVSRIPISGKLPDLRKYVPFAAAVLGACLLAAPYYVAAHVATDGDFTNKFFLSQNLGRLQGVVNHQNPPQWYLEQVLIPGFFPCSILMFPAIFGLVKGLKRNKTLSRGKQLNLFALCWFVSTFTLLSIIPTKLPTYILPIAPALAILSAGFLMQNRKLGQKFFCYVMIPLMLVGLIAAPWAVQSIWELTPQEWGTFLGYSGGAALATIVALALSLKRKLKQATVVALGLIVATTGFLTPFFYRVFYSNNQLGIQRLVDLAKDNGAELAICDAFLPSMVFDLRKPVPVVQDEKDWLKFSNGGATPNEPRWIVIHRANLDCLYWCCRCPVVIAREGKWWLFALGPNAMKEGGHLWGGRAELEQAECEDARVHDKSTMAASLKEILKTQ